MTGRWRNRPAGSNWGEFGDDDQLGRLNLLTAERVVRAAAEIRTGKVFSLSLPLTLPGGSVLAPRRKPPRLFTPARGHGRANYLYPLSLDNETATDVICDDAVLLYTQYSTQWDALSHVGSAFDADGDGEPELVFYNGWRAEEHIKAPAGPTDSHGLMAGPEAGALGIERMAETGVQGRGVMVDLRHHCGASGEAVGYERLRRILEADGIVVETGDILCLHTGFAQMLIEMKGTPDPARLFGECAALDGRDDKLLDWISDSGISAIAADNFAVEVLPSSAGHGHCASLPLHEHCLFKLGLPLGELWYLTELAAWLRDHGRSRFFLTAPPLNLPGAVGSPVTPVATT